MDEINPARLRQLSDVRDSLLHLHKALLDGQRRRYEQEHGKVASPGAFLQLAISDPAFEWLHRFSELVVQIDEATYRDARPSGEEANILLEQARQLLMNPAVTVAIKVDPHASRLAGDLQDRLSRKDS